MATLGAVGKTPYRKAKLDKLVWLALVLFTPTSRISTMSLQTSGITRLQREEVERDRKSIHKTPLMASCFSS